MRVADLPLLNACLNAAVALLLLRGLWLIRQGRRGAHERTMIAAVTLSALFLVSYVVYHLEHGTTRFAGEGWSRPVYFTILGSHTVLAVVSLPFILLALARAVRGDLAAHKRIAKRVWAVWLYVAITGPLVYLMLHRLFPAPSSAAEGPPASAEAEALFREGRAFHRLQQDAEALAKYRQASSIGHLAARCYAATIEARLAGTNTATAAIERALAADPGNAHCRVLKARALVAADRGDEAITLLEPVVKAAPDDAFFQATLGYAYFRRSRYAEAAAAFERSIHLDGDLAANVYNAGYANYLNGDFAQAKPLLERALEKGLDPDTAERAKSDLAVITGKSWICPMHPDEVGVPGDSCPICRMKLERAPNALP